MHERLNSLTERADAIRAQLDALKRQREAIKQRELVLSAQQAQQRLRDQRSATKPV